MEETIAAEIDQLAKIYSDSREGLPGSEINRLVNAIVHAYESAPRTRTSWLPQGYLSLRQIEESLDRSMWAGFGCAKVARQFLEDRHETGKRDAGFAPRRKLVGAVLEAAFFAGRLTLYILANEASLREHYQQLPPWAKDPIPLPKALLGCVFVGDGHGRMPGTFAIRPSRKLAGSDRLLGVLNCSHQLVVREADFRRWLRSNRRKRKWPSQGKPNATPKGNPVGRPNKLDTALRTAILRAGQEKVWIGARPVVELHRLLSGQGLNVPSVVTLARKVDALFAETGEPWLGRRRRVRRG